MNANIALTEPRVEPITHPQAQFISVHLRSSAAKIFLPADRPRVCDASRGFADMSGFMESLY
jgi:hypothetical protein